MASAFVRLILPRIPLMVKQTILHILSLSPTASKWDLRTELIITVLRSILSGSTSSISRQQNFSLKDPGAAGPMWVSRVTLPQPSEDDVRQLLFKAVVDMGVSGNETFTKPDLLPVEGEWNGYRPGVSNKEPEPKDMSEEERYKRLMKEVSSDATVLYFHGGAYYMMDPSSHRRTTSQLAKLTKGRVFSVRYRLAPQHPFPAAVLDCLVAYLSLLYPPKGSLHEPVKPEHIVFAGDSAGGNMCLVLLQLLLHLQRNSNATVNFNGTQVTLPLPGGLATNSAWCDVTRCLPSLYNNAKYDYLPPPKRATSLPSQDPVNIHTCKLWPSDPPRVDLYCDGSALCHPLVSPLAAPTESWKGAPPILFIAGEEMLSDEIAVVAGRCVQQGVKVRWEGYEGMPHCFAMLLEGQPVSKRCFQGWADFVDGVVNSKEEVNTGGVWVEAKTLKEKDVKVEDLINLKDDEVRRLMDTERERRIKVFKAYQQRLSTGGTEKAKL